MLEMFIAFQEKIKDILKIDVAPAILPSGFVDKQQSVLMLEVMAKIWPKKEIIGVRGRQGLRFKMGFFHMEIYVCAAEPVIEDFEHFRIICWQPLTRIEKPIGWHEDWLYLPSQCGVVELKNRYWENWSNHAKRHRQKWLRDEAHEIVEADLETFSAAYDKNDKVGKFLRANFLKTLRLHLKHHPKDVCLYVARRKDNQNIIGGLAIINYPDISESTHAISFINRTGFKTSVGTGLIDYWYRDSLKKGLRFLNFGLVWKRGDPKGWRGYSQFKKQFVPTLLPYRYQFVKFVSGVRGCN